MELLYWFYLFLLALIHPTKENTLEIDKKLLEQENKDLEVINYSQDKSLAVWLENSFLVSFLISIMGFVYIISHFIKGGDLNLNVLNMDFFYFWEFYFTKSLFYILKPLT